MAHASSNDKSYIGALIYNNGSCSGKVLFSCILMTYVLFTGCGQRIQKTDDQLTQEENYRIFDFGADYHNREDRITTKNQNIANDNERDLNSTEGKNKSQIDMFGALMDGDFSKVNLNEKQKEEMDYIYSLIENRGIASSWYRLDVTGDGIDELIWEDSSPFDDRFKTVIAIFKLKDNEIDRLYWDVNNNTRYLFIGDNNLISYDDLNSIYSYVCYRETFFEDNGNEYYTYAISAYIIYNYDNIVENENLKKRLNERGIAGKGIYFFRVKYKKDGTVEQSENLERDEFMEAFRTMTGKSLNDVDPYWASVFEMKW